MDYFRRDTSKIEEEIDTDMEEEEEDIRNEEPLHPIESEFKNLVLLIKKKLYKNIIFGPTLHTKEAQDNKLLVIYLKKLTSLHLLCNRIQYNPLSDAEINTILKEYPAETRPIIKRLIHWITTFFNKNNVVDILPYTDYLETHLHRHPLLQK